MVIGMVSCIDKTPDYGNFPSSDVDFTYNVDGDQFVLDFYVVSTIKFNNTSAKSGAVSWDFGDGNTSTDANPTHKYDKAGVYQVTLNVDGVGSRTYPLMIYDIAPVLSVTKQSETPIVINDVKVELGIFLPNPENLTCKYDWTFPEGTMRNVNGTWEAISQWTGYSHEDGSIDYPGELKFKNIGSQKIEIKTIFDYQGAGERRLEDSYVNVQVGCSYPCKTVYYAVKDGNIMAYKLVDMSKLPAGTKNGAFDLGVKSGSTPTTMLYKNIEGQDYIYILDCGKQYTYINDVETRNQGDGKITVMNADGTGVNTVVTNVGGCAFNDPFQGCVDDQYIYYTDRNTGVLKLPLSTRGEKEISFYNNETGNYMVTNQQLAYYGAGISYGAIHTGIYLDASGVFYWTKNYSGYGIYRFKQSDIKQPKISYPIILPGISPRAVTIDEGRKQLYVWLEKDNPGLNVFDLPAYDATCTMKDVKSYVSMDADPVNSTEAEGLFVTQMSIDKATGYVYFGFNANKTETNYTTGLKYYDPITKKVVNFNGNKDRIFGVVICDTEAKLF